MLFFASEKFLCFLRTVKCARNDWKRNKSQILCCFAQCEVYQAKGQEGLLSRLFLTRGCRHERQGVHSILLKAQQCWQHLKPILIFTLKHFAQLLSFYLFLPRIMRIKYSFDYPLTILSLGFSFERVLKQKSRAVNRGTQFIIRLDSL